MKYITFLSYGIWLCFLQSSFQQFVAFDLYRLINSIFIKFEIGTPKMILFQSLDQEIDYFWTINHFWNINRSKTGKILHNTTIYFQFNNSFEAFTVEDTLHLNNSNSINFEFKYISSENDLISSLSSVGLPLQYKDNKYSLPHILKSNNLINHLAYSIITIKNSGILYLGGIPQGVIDNMQTGSCKVNSHYSTWNCKLNQIFLQHNGNKLYYKNTQYSFFQAKSKTINVPLDYFMFLKENVFRPYLENKTCSEINQETKYLLCKYDIIRYLPTITFVFDNIGLSVPLQKLTEHYSNEKKLLIVNESNQNSQWVFGFNFLLEFQTLFDYDNQKITFYSDNNILVFSEQIYRKILFLILTSILLAGVMFIIIIKYKGKII